jgi:hypothetical protein
MEWHSHPCQIELDPAAWIRYHEAKFLFLGNLASFRKNAKNSRMSASMACNLEIVPMTARFRIITLIGTVLLLSTFACNMSNVLSQDGTVGVETRVASTLEVFAATLTQQALSGTLPPLSPTDVPTTLASPTVTAQPSPTFTPPPEGISLNCDGTYQRVRVVDGGATGKTLFVENWDGSTWVEVWRIEGGDPMNQQIEDEAGTYLFGECQYLVIVPIRYSGSGAVLELHIYTWDGAGMVEVYSHDGVHGDWHKLGDMITFEESIYLYDEPNCCPCNRQYLEHTWDGIAFNQTGSLISPTYEGTPPPECQP